MAEAAVDRRRTKPPRSDAPKVLHIATVDSTVRFMLLGQLVSMQAQGFDVAAMSASGPWVAGIEAAGIRFIPWPHADRRFFGLKDLRAFLHLLRVVRRERFDIVHTHNPKPGAMGRIAARLSATPLVVNTVHGFYATTDDRSLKARLIMFAEWVASRFSHFELYQSAEDAARAVELGIARRGRWLHLGNGTDTSRFAPDRVDRALVTRLRTEWDIPDDALVVGMVGRLVAEKGWLDFFEAARRLHRTRPEIVFLAVGPHDPDKPDALDERTLDGARRDVRIVGHTMHVAEALSLMDVFVLTSYREGLPRSAVEAAAMAKPLVLTDIRGCREVVSDGVNGFLVPPARPDVLAETIERLVSDPGLRFRLGTASRERSIREFDERSVVARTVGVYDAKLAQGRGRR